MRILYIVDEGNVGGAAHSFVEVMLQMKRLGVEPVVVNSIPNDLNDFLNKENIENYSVGHKPALTPFFSKFPKSIIIRALLTYRYYQGRRKAMRNVAKMVDMSGLNLIHTNSARNDLGCYLSKKYHISHVVHFREFADLDFNCALLNPLYYRMMNSYSACFITISDAVQLHWKKKGLDAKKMITVYNGIHYQDISVSPDENKKKSNLKMVITGGVFPTKGQHLAVEAMCQLPDDIKSYFTLDIIGWYSESYVQQMKRTAKDGGIIDQIHFLGSRNDVPKLLGDYEIGLMCSRAEGFGRTTAEYMHAGLGVIASDSGANPELIDDGVSGLLFKSGDSGSLCDCLRHYYHNRTLLINCSKKAQAKARACYTDMMNAENIYKVYKKIVK